MLMAFASAFLRFLTLRNRARSFRHLKKIICFLFSLLYAVFSRAQVFHDQFPIKNLSEFSVQSFALIDSAGVIWKDLRNDILLDTSLLSRAEIETILRVSSSLDAALNACLKRERERVQQEAQTFNDAMKQRSPAAQDSALSQARSVFFKRQRALADTILWSQDSLSRAIETFFLSASDRRTSSATPDYKSLLEQFSNVQRSPHSFDAGFSYQSQSVWRGIDQNDGKGAYSLVATYRHQIGAFVLAQALGMQGRSPFIDQFSLGVGFERELFDDFIASLSYTRYFYSDSSIQVRSSINSDVGLRFSYSLPWMTSSTTFIWAIGDAQNDFICSWELSQPFAFQNFLGGDLLLVPSVSAEYGTVSSVRAVARRLRNGRIVRNVSESSPFVLTNYNVSLSAIYAFGALSFIPELIYAIPINVPSLSITRMNLTPSGSVTNVFNQQASAFFYFSTSLYLSL